MKRSKLFRIILAVSASFGMVVSSTSMAPFIHADDTDVSYYRSVNDNKSTLSNHWNYDHIHYSDLDHENRSGKDTAYLESKNVTNDALRQRQEIEPTGWHQKRINGDWIINRGHEIAYSLSRGITSDGHYNGSDHAGDQNNPKNLFTQTAYSNQQVQTIFESEVRESLESGERVIYQVTPVFHGDDEMASGVHMQARSTDGSLDFNVYLYNKQPGVKFNYRTGRSVITGATTRQNYVNDYYHRQNSYGYGNNNYDYHQNYSTNSSNYENYANYHRNYLNHYNNYGYRNYGYRNSADNYNNTGYHRTYYHHWSPLQREHWYNTMRQRYWSRSIR